MSWRATIPTAVALALIMPNGARACSLEQFDVRFPGETLEEAQKRSDKILWDGLPIERFLSQRDAFARAKTVYLGKVVQSGRIERDWSMDRFWTRVMPVHAIKGTLPAGPTDLSSVGSSGMCSSIGDGEGSGADLNDYVVVFEGLARSEDFPRGIDSYALNDIRDWQILRPIKSFGEDISGERFQQQIEEADRLEREMLPESPAL